MATSNVYSLNFGNPKVPEVLKGKDRWVIWRFVKEKDKDGKMRITKPPFQARHPDRYASTTDPSTWASYDEACKSKPRDGGIGFVLGDGIGGMDLDNCLDEEYVPHPWAQELINEAQSYSEVTPSEKGCHVIGFTEGGYVHEKVQMSTGSLELYRGEFIGRYITFTDYQQNDYEMQNIDAVIDRYRGWVNKKEDGKTDSSTGRDETGSGYGRRFLQERRAKGDDYEMARDKMLRHEGRAGDWARKVDERQIVRAWEATTVRRGRAVELEVIRGDEVEIRPIEWMWPGIFAYGKIGMIAGEPDQGKSQLLLHIAACVSRGGKWPSGERAKTANVIILTAEDDLDDTVIPRFVAAGGDLSRVFFISMTRDTDGERSMFSLNEDLVILERKIKQIGNVGLVGIDPITAYMGVAKIDSYRTSDVRGVLAPFKDLTNRYRFSSLFISHFNKNTKMANSLSRITDSSAFGAMPRHVYVTLPDPDEEGSYLFLRCKNNLVRKTDNTGYRYMLEEKMIKRVMAPYLVWEDKVDVSADEVLAELNSKLGRPAKEAKRIKEWLLEELAKGDLEPSRAYKLAEQNNIKARTLRQVASALGLTGQKIRKLPPEEE